jgi:hypothetical protein
MDMELLGKVGGRTSAAEDFCCGCHLQRGAPAYSCNRFCCCYPSSLSTRHLPLPPACLPASPTCLADPPQHRHPRDVRRGGTNRGHPAGQRRGPGAQQGRVSAMLLGLQSKSFWSSPR